MQVLCMSCEKGPADVVCPVCNQSYVLYFSRPGDPERESAIEAVKVTLAAHHDRDPKPSAHPAELFNVPAWNGPADMSGAALLSGAPVRRSTMAQGVTERFIV